MISEPIDLIIYADSIKQIADYITNKYVLKTTTNADTIHVYLPSGKIAIDFDALISFITSNYEVYNKSNFTLYDIIDVYLFESLSDSVNNMLGLYEYELMPTLH
jgi:hypothetical protein